MNEPVIHGVCPDCQSVVASGEGVTVDPEGRAWHADCRRVYNRKNRHEVIEGTATTIPAAAAPKRRARKADEVTA